MQYNILMRKNSEIIDRCERALRDIENALGVSITVIDAGGFLRFHDGSSLLKQSRQTHKKNDVCKFDFCELCRQHCRYEMQMRSQKKSLPYIHTCWKGVCEVVVPIYDKGHFIANAYAGPWRTLDKSKTPKSPPLSKKMVTAYEKLDVLDEPAALRIGEVLSFFFQGIVSARHGMVTSSEQSEPSKQAILEFIRYRLRGNIRLADLADEVCLSESRTSHVVKSFFNISFQELLIRERLYSAMSILESTSLPIYEVAKHVGIDNPPYFNRLFKSRVGVSPSEYRKRQTR